MNNNILPELPRYQANGAFPFKADYWYDSRIKKDAMVKITAFRKGTNYGAGTPMKREDVILAWFKVYDFKTPKAYVVINGVNVKLTDMRILR